MDRTGYQLFTRARLAQNQDRGFRWRDFCDFAKHSAERIRRPDDILKHRVTIDLFPQRQVFVARSLFVPDTVINVGARLIPLGDLSALVSKRVVLNQEPAVLTVLSERSMLEFERQSLRESSLSFDLKSFQVLRMKDFFPKVWRSHIVSSKARIGESGSIGVDRQARRVLNNYCLPGLGPNLPTVAFILPKLLFRLLKGFDISADSVPHYDLSGFIAVWFEANEKPTKDSIMSAHARFDVAWFTGNQQFPPSLHQCRQILRMDRHLPAPAL